MAQPTTRERIFSKPWLEKLTTSNTYVIIGTHILIAILVFVLGLQITSLSTVAILGLFISGILVYSLSEYLIHRFIFHSGDPNNKTSWQNKIHGIHHAYPQDGKRLGIPIPFALILAAVFFLIFYGVLGQNALFFFPAFLLAYALQLLLHFVIHTRQAPKSILRVLWFHHYVHHYRNPNLAYGVTSTIWDEVFNTMPSKNIKTRNAKSEN